MNRINKRNGIFIVGVFAFLCILLSDRSFGQSYNEGTREFVDRNYNKALSIFQKVNNDDPNNELAVYYLGQTYIKLNQIDKAQQLYSDALTKNKKLAKSSLLNVGLGHVMLLKGDSIFARVKFEESITMMKKNQEADVLTAIGRANLEEKGDLYYAIETLEKATAAKNFSDSRTYVYLGLAYKRLHNGSKSVQAFTNATRMNPSEAEAYHEIGKIFATQNNVDVFLSNYYKAVEADDRFSPIYLDLYSYFFSRLQIDSAKKYLSYYEQKIEMDDQSKALIDLFKAEISYLEKKYDESLAKLNQVNPDASTYIGKVVEIRKYRLKALDLEALGINLSASSDSLKKQQAAQNKQQAFLSIQRYMNENSKMLGGDEQIDFSDVMLYTRILAETDQQTKDEYFPKTLDIVLNLNQDPLLQAKFLAQIEEICKRAGATKEIALTKLKRLQTKKEPVSNEYFEVGSAFFSAGMYQQADSFFSIYTQKEPEQPFGYYWLASTYIILDSTYEKAKPYFEKYINVAQKNAKDNQAGLIKAYTFMGTYYTKKGKDYPKAIEWWSKLLEIDPTNAAAAKVKTVLEQHLKSVEANKKSREEYQRKLKELQPED